MSNNKEVGIIVVTYNRCELLKEVIYSLRKQTFKNSQIIVVNNGSTDNTFNWLTNQNDIITINQENLGGAGGFYTGIKYAVENGYNYCWIMDDDVICHETALEELINSYKKNPNIGFICSKVVGINDQAMNTPTISLEKNSNGYIDWYDKSDEGLIKVKAATFVSVCISSKVVNNVGLPFKEYFIWGDDSEYTTRISNQYSCYMSLYSKVIHKRILQNSLSFAEETNINRLKFYKYKFRNEAHQNKKNGIKAILKDHIWFYSQIFKYIIKFDLLRSRILILSYLEYISFNPKITFPRK